MKLTVIVLIGQDNNEVKAKRARLADSPRFAGEAGAMAKRAIDSVSFADEVLVVKEEFSISDFSEVRNRALDRSKGEWVLFVDLDEVVSQQLAREIKRVVKFSNNGYFLRRQDKFLSRWLRYGETASVRLLRLARKDAGIWVRPVHEVWNVKGKVGELKNPLLHYSHETVEEMVEKLDRYSDIEAKYRLSVIPCLTRNPRSVPAKAGIYLYRFLIGSGMTSRFQLTVGMALFPVGKFVQNYIFRLGFLDGMPGFIHAGMMSFHSFLVRAKILSRKQETGNNDQKMNTAIGLFFLASWISGQIVRWPGNFPVTLLDVAVGIAVIDSLAKIIRGWTVWRNQILPCRTASLLRKFANFANSQIISLWMIVILIFSWVLGLRLFSLQQSLPGGLYLLRFLGYLWMIVNADKLLAPVKKFITPAFWIFVILAWAQYLFLPDTRFLLQYGWDEHYYRMIGTVLDPNYLGLMLGMIGVYTVNKRTNGALALLSLGGVIVTFSRASWLAVGIGLSFFVIPYLIRNLCKFIYIDSPIKSGNDRKESGLIIGKVAIGLVIAGIVFGIAPKPGGEGVNLFRTSSIEQRVESWREGINVWREHPWLGVGFNNYAVAKARGINGSKTGLSRIDHAENSPSSSWILLLATTGVIGLGWLAMVGWLAVRNINRLWLGILVMIGIHSIFNNTMFYPPILGLLVLIKAANAD